MDCVNTQWLPASAALALFVVVAAASISLSCSIQLCFMGLGTTAIAGGPLDIIKVPKEHSTLHKPPVCVCVCVLQQTCIGSGPLQNVTCTIRANV